MLHRGVKETQAKSLCENPRRFLTRARNSNETVTCSRKRETAKGGTAMWRERCLFADSQIWQSGLMASSPESAERAESVAALVLLWA
jgi:hypothetical protein